MTCLSPAEVDAYLDGELGHEQVDDFCRHLPGCERCRARLERAVHLQSMALAAYPSSLPGETPPSGIPTARPSGRHDRVARPRWARRSFAFVGAMMPIAVALVLILHSQTRPGGEVAQGAAPEERRVRGRLTYGPLDEYAPWDPPRGSEKQVTRVRLEEMVPQQRSDPRSAPSHHLASNELGAAETLFQALQDSPERSSDLAAVALAKHDPAAALELASRALDQSPRLPQAMWNRALALSDLGFSREAAAAFREVAALKEPGWSAEAADRAAQEDARAAKVPAGTRANPSARERWAQAGAALEAGDRSGADRLLLEAVRECGSAGPCWR